MAEERKKIIVCGDSFMTPPAGETFAGTHFSQLIAKELDYDLEAYSRCAMSNGGICLQIENAVAANPDLVLIGISFPDRVEIDATGTADKDIEFLDLKVNTWGEYPEDAWTVGDMQYYALEKGPSGPGQARHDVTQFDHYKNFKQQSARIITDGLITLIGVNKDYGATGIYPHIPEYHEKTKALEQWFLHLYHPGWKRKIDQWCLDSVLHKLHRSGVSYLIVYDWTAVDLEWMTEEEKTKHRVEHIARPEVRSYFSNQGFFRRRQQDPGYHTTVESQERIAKFLLAHLRKHKMV